MLNDQSVPLPPANARVQTTACAYCIVACGYKVYSWPEGQNGGAKAKENALGIDFPMSDAGAWIGPNQHAKVKVDGLSLIHISEPTRPY